MRSKLLGALALAIVLTACGGGGGGSATASAGSDWGGTGGVPSTPSTSQKAAATGALAQNVIVLSDAQNAQYAGRNAAGDQVTFNGQVDLTAGQVVVGATDAFKVASVQQVNGNTVVTVTEPALEELFDNLEISGSFTADASSFHAEQVLQRTLSSGTRPQILATDLGRYSWQTMVATGGSTLTAGLNGTLSADVNYKFTRAEGLQRAHYVVHTDNTLSAAFTVNKDAKGSKEAKIGTVRIPIPVSFVDRLLNTVGVRVVSIVVPFFVGVDGDAKFAIDYKATATYNGSMGIDYVAGSDAQLIFDGDVQGDNNSFAPTTPAGSPILATFTANTGMFLHMRPALAFLDQVALLGADTKLKANAKNIAQIVQPPPGYCLNSTGTVDIAVSGFFKTVGVSATTPSISKNLFTSKTAQLGSCRSPVTVDITSTSPSPAVAGKNTAFNVTVNQDPGGIVVPDAGPSGTVVVKVGSAECTAALTQQSNSSSTGSCSLIPPAAGTAVPVNVVYAGDTAYSPLNTTKSVRIDQTDSLGLVGSSSPNPSSSGQAVVLTASLQGVASMPVPTGTVRFFGSGGQLLCTATVNEASSASCSTSFNLDAGSQDITPAYSGDAVYKPLTGLIFHHNELSAPFSATGTSRRTDGGCTGTMSLTGTAAFNVGAGTEAFVSTGTQTLQNTCFNQTIGAPYYIPLTRSGNTFSGHFHNNFGSGDSDVTITGTISQSGTQTVVTATITSTIVDVTGFRAQATGTVTARSQ